MDICWQYLASHYIILSTLNHRQYWIVINSDKKLLNYKYHIHQLNRRETWPSSGNGQTYWRRFTLISPSNTSLVTAHNTMTLSKLIYLLYLDHIFVFHDITFIHFCYPPLSVICVLILMKKKNYAPGCPDEDKSSFTEGWNSPRELDIKQIIIHVQGLLSLAEYVRLKHSSD